MIDLVMRGDTVVTPQGVGAHRYPDRGRQDRCGRGTQAACRWPTARG